MIYYLSMYYALLQVLQNRQNGLVNFNKTWAEYAEGFGTISGEFWLGNDNINYLTANQQFLLRIELETFEGIRKIAEYGDFSLGDSSSNYTLDIGYYHSRSDAGECYNKSCLYLVIYLKKRISWHHSFPVILYNTPAYLFFRIHVIM